MLPGLVSNCWRTQLAGGAALDELIAEASRQGFRAVELRQTCLGGYERGDDPLPDAEALAALPKQFPAMRLSVAVNVPFLDPQFCADDPVFTAGKWAAQAVAGESPPHLRLVDLTTIGERFMQVDAAAAGTVVRQLTRSLIELDGILSVENSRQPWTAFRAIFDSARQQLGGAADRLRICFDPCNLLFPGDGVDPTAITRSLQADELSMVHFKQRRDGSPLAVVSDGDIDWAAGVRALRQIRYSGPGLFEIESDEQIWNHLVDSRRYLRRLGLEIEGEPAEAE